MRGEFQQKECRSGSDAGSEGMKYEAGDNFSNNYFSDDETVYTPVFILFFMRKNKYTKYKIQTEAKLTALNNMNWPTVNTLFSAVMK